MNKNVGTIDRILRIIVALVLGYLLFSGAVATTSILGIVMIVISVIFAFTGLVGWCAIYSLFGASTCPAKTQ